MSEEENSQKKAQSVIVDFYVIFKKFESISLAGLTSCILILVSIYFLMAYDPFGDNELPYWAKISFVLNLFLPAESATATSNLSLLFNIEPKVVPAALKFNHGLLN